MKLEEEILLNLYGQGLVDRDSIVRIFNQHIGNEKREFLNDFIFVILQSKPQDEDILPAILNSGLKPTYTPCVLLKKGMKNVHFEALAKLPEGELSKVILLLLSVFRIAYYRRFLLERNHPDKWWYWDLSDNRKLDLISKGQQY